MNRVISLSRCVQWRLKAKSGTRLEPRERSKVDIIEVPPRFRSRIRERQKEVTAIVPVEVIQPEELLDETFRGIKEIVDTADLGVLEKAELKVLEEAPGGEVRTFVLHEGVDFFVPIDDDQKLNLSQVYLYEREARVYALPRSSSDIPDSFRDYLAMEWDTWISGYSPEYEEEMTQAHKVYFIARLPLKDPRGYPDVDFKEVYCIDGESRSIERMEVIDQTTKATEDPVLSILEDKIVIRDSDECPSHEEIAAMEDEKDARLRRQEEDKAEEKLKRTYEEDSLWSELQYEDEVDEDEKGFEPDFDPDQL